MHDLLKQTEPRLVRLLLSVSLLVIGTLLFTFLLWPQVELYRSLQETRTRLQQIVQSGDDLPVVLDQERRQVEQVSRRLHGDMAGLPMEQMESYIIGRLQKISWQTGVELVSVQPTEGESVHIFREILFQVEVAARYMGFFDWLQELGRELGFVVIKDYEMAPIDRKELDPVLRVRLTMASYRVEG